MKIARPILSNLRYRLSATPTTRSGNRTGRSAARTTPSVGLTTLSANRTTLCADWTTLCFAGHNGGKNLDISGSKAVAP